MATLPLYQLHPTPIAAHDGATPSEVGQGMAAGAGSGGKRQKRLQPRPSRPRVAPGLQRLALALAVLFVAAYPVARLTAADTPIAQGGGHNDRSANGGIGGGGGGGSGGGTGGIGGGGGGSSIPTPDNSGGDGGTIGGGGGGGPTNMNVSLFGGAGAGIDGYPGYSDGSGGPGGDYFDTGGPGGTSGANNGGGSAGTTIYSIRGGGGGGGSGTGDGADATDVNCGAGGGGLGGDGGSGFSGTGQGGGGGAGYYLINSTDTITTNLNGGKGGVGIVGGGGGAGAVLLGAGVTVTVDANVNGGDGRYGGGGGAGMVLYEEGSITNNAAITGGGVDSYGADGGAGVFLVGNDGKAINVGKTAGGTLTNTGSVNGGAGGDSPVAGGKGGAGVLANNGVVANSGTITGGDGGDDTQNLGGYSGGTGGDGVHAWSAGGMLTSTVTNDSGNTISGGKGGDSATGNYGAGGAGVRLSGTGGLLVNRGAVVGGLNGDASRGDAVVVTGSGNTVELYSTYSFSGGVTATGSGHTLRLAAGGGILAAGDAYSGFDIFEIHRDWTISTTTDLGFAGKTLKFDLTGVQAGETVATRAFAEDITGATVVLTGGIPSLQVGNRVTLLDQVSGTPATSVPIENTIAGFKYVYNIVSGSSLSLFHNGIETAGDWTAPASPYTVTAGATSGEDVFIRVDGTLHAGDFSVASSAVASAEVRAGTFDAATLTLTKNAGDLRVDIGRLDATARDVTVTLNNTAAWNGSSGVRVAHLDLGDGLTARTLTVNGGGAWGVDRLEIRGAGNILTGTGAMDMAGKTLAFDLTGVVNGQTLLTAADNLTTDAATVVAITGTALGHGDSVTLAAGVAAGSVFTDQVFQSAGNRYQITLDTATRNLSLIYFGQSSYRDDAINLFGPGGYLNINIIRGGAYLDELFAGDLAATNPALATRIDAAYNSAIAPGGKLAAHALQQVYGAYAAYANQALAVDAGRFRQVRRARTRTFLDESVFADFLPETAAAGLASGSGLASPVSVAETFRAGQSRLWADGFGSWARQDAHGTLAGYKYDAQGAALGYEYAVGCFNFGFGAAYSRGTLKVNDLRYKNEADILNLALYGAYSHESGFYAEAGLGYGHAWNDYRVASISHAGGVSTGDYGSDSFSADVELGYIARLPADFNLIPSAGIEYTYLRNGSWTEGANHTALLAKRFDSGHDNGVNIPLGLRINRLFRLGCDGGYLAPELRAAFIYRADKSRPSIQSGLVGAPGKMKMEGVDPGRSHWRIGAGVAGRLNSRVDFRIDYDFETRSGFKGHNLNASLGLSF